MTESLFVISGLYPHLSSATDDSDCVEVIVGSQFRQDGVNQLLVLPFDSYLNAEAASSATAASATALSATASSATASSATASSATASSSKATNGKGNRGQSRKVTGPKSPFEVAQKRERNRLAARQCRQKKKEHEKRQKQNLRQMQDEISHLQHRVKRLSALYLNCLCYLETKAAFYEYLKRNQELVRDPESKRLLLEFMESGFKYLV